MITWHPLALLWLKLVMYGTLIAWVTAIVTAAVSPLFTGDGRLSQAAEEVSERVWPVTREATALWFAAVVLGRPW